MVLDVTVLSQVVRRSPKWVCQVSKWGNQSTVVWACGEAGHHGGSGGAPRSVNLMCPGSKKGGRKGLGSQYLFQWCSLMC